MSERKINRILLRGLRLKCPACGKGSLFRSGFAVNESCPCCSMIFLREQGYFIGALYINIAATELLIGFVYLLALLAVKIADDIIYPALFALALILPILFYRHARSFWLSLDYLIDPPPGSEERALKEGGC